MTKSMMKMKTNILRLFSVMFTTTLLLALSGVSYAMPGNQGDVSTINIDINGTIVANGSCKFNQGSSLTVDFGDIRLTASGTNTVTLDGNYIQPIVSDFQCSGDSAGLLQMQLSNIGDNYETYNGTQVLGTQTDIVGIELLVNGAPQDMGQWFTVDQNDLPTLQAQLVQLSTTNSKNVVSGDTFSTSGTLKLSFN